jgi:hypothetical protein
MVPLTLSLLLEQQTLVAVVVVRTLWAQETMVLVVQV